MEKTSQRQFASRSISGPHVRFAHGQQSAPQSATSQVVIPARLASTRLPRKLLLSETGKPLIQHTYEAACQARRPQGVCVAADSEEIAAVVRGFGGEVLLTSPDCASGTDRIAEVANRLGEVDIVVNVQGDEPEISADAIDLAVELLDRNPAAAMATLATPIRTREKLLAPSCVKVVLAALPYNADLQLPEPHLQLRTAYSALYFSRAAIPHPREWRDDLLLANPPHFFQHVGLYAYRRDFLLHLARLPRTPLERLENLEQLRALEHGHQILVGIVDHPAIGIDTPADYAAFVARRRAAG